MAADHLPKLATMRDALIDQLSPIEGAAVEDNTFSVSVHYRNCAPESVQQVRRQELISRLVPSCCLSAMGSGLCSVEASSTLS